MEEQTQEETPNFLDQVKAERELMEKVREDNTKLLKQLQELKAQEILGGTSTGKEKEEVKEEENASDYALRVLKGKL